ncbi:MCE family protein [Nocardioides sp.]|uniref:MCE family protein n=1 Tax=Nocardioides sp. TaxID=35761 RepID=UPI003517F031
MAMKPFRERNPIIIGAASILTLVLLIAVALQAGKLPIIGGGDVYYAEFSEAGGLKTGDEVRVAGVRVGKVETIELVDGVVRVGFRMENDEDLGAQTGAAIRIKTLLGAMFVALQPAGDGELEPDDVIPVERTSSPFDVVDAFEGLADTIGESSATGIDTDQLARSLTTLADLSRNTPEEFRGALDGVSRLSRNLAARDDQINSLLVNLKRVTSVLDDRDTDLISLMKDADVLFEALLQRREQVHQLLVATSEISTELTAFARDSREDLKPALADLKSVLDVLNKNENNLDRSLRLMAPFYRVFTNTLGTGPWFDTYISNLPPIPSLTGGAG